MEEKAVLRRKMKDRLAVTPEARFLAAGITAARILRVSGAWADHKTVLLFLSLKDEIDTLPILEAAFDDNKFVFLPRIEAGPDKSGKKMSFYRIAAGEQIASLPRGPFGIREPVPLHPLSRGDFPALVITPGLAFDAQNNRLGRGGGFYDRFFAELPGLGYVSAGLCLREQVLPSVPAAEWDRKVDVLFPA